MNQNLPERRTARLFLFDPDNRLLLIRYKTTPPIRPPHENAGSVWFTPGGGVDPGETVLQAAARELREETGLTVPIGPEVAYREQNLTFFKKKVFAVERYFLVRAVSAEINTSLLYTTEGDTVEEVRWWKIEELASSEDLIDPRSLIALAGQLAIGRLPKQLVNLSTPH